MDNLMCNGMSEVCNQLAESMRLDIARLEGKIEIAKEYGIVGIIKLRKEIKSKQRFERGFIKKAEIFKKLAEVNKDD